MIVPGSYEPLPSTPHEDWQRAEKLRRAKRDQCIGELQREIDRAKRTLHEYNRPLGELRALQNEKRIEAEKAKRR